MEKIVEFSGFRDFAPPGQLADMIVELYGADAGAAAKECVASAFADRRYNDYCFWLAVLGMVEEPALASDAPELESPRGVWTETR